MRKVNDIIDILMNTQNRKPTKRSLSEIAIENAHGGAGSRQLIFSDKDTFVSSQFEAMTKGFLAKGGMFDWHEHDGIDEFYIVTAGTGCIEYEDGTTFNYAAGDVVYSPANIKHKLTNLGEDANEFFFIRIRE